MDKVKYNDYSEILSGDFNRTSQYIEDALGCVLQDFFASTSVVVGLEIKAQAVADMTVYATPGRLYQSGRQGALETQSNAITVTSAHPQYNRVDRICAKYIATEDMPEIRNTMVDVSSRQVDRRSVNTRIHGGVAFQVIPGVASANPTPQEAPDGWVSLAQVVVRANASFISPSDIMDERPLVQALPKFMDKINDHIHNVVAHTANQITVKTASGIKTVQDLANTVATKGALPGRNMVVSGPLSANGVAMALRDRYSANLCVGGMPISGGDYVGCPAASAFAGDGATTYWWSNISTELSGVAWLGYRFSTPENIRKIKLSQSAMSNYITAGKVQASIDGITWVDVLSVTLIQGDNTVYLPSSSGYVYWRILAMSNTTNNSNWSVYELEMYALQDATLTDSDIQLLAGTNLSFAAGFTVDGPKDYSAVVGANIPLTLPPADCYTVPLSYTDDLCNGGTAISSGASGTDVAANAFDNSRSSLFRSNQAGAGVKDTVYIGYQFTNPKQIRKITLDLENGLDNGVSDFEVQYSSNGSTWSKAMLFTIQIASTAYNRYQTSINVPPVANATYWRIIARSNCGTGTWVLYEMEMMEALQTHYIYADRATDGTLSLISTKQKPRVQTAPSDTYTDNLCVGGTAIADSFIDIEVFRANKDNAFDGNSTTRWKTAKLFEDSKLGAWIGYDFGVARTIRKIIINFGVSGYAPTNVKVQYSTDGVNWDDSITFSPNAPINIMYPVKGTARYWRILSNGYSLFVQQESMGAFEITMHELATNINHYDPTTGISRHWDGTAWTQVQRVPVGEAVTDSAGKIVSYKTYDYGLINYLRASEIVVDKLTVADDGTAGKVAYFARSTAPAGWLKVNGASLSKAAYANLFAAIGYTFGGSGDAFNLPDLRGEFIRGFDDGRGVDTGRSFGSYQAESTKATIKGYQCDYVGTGYTSTGNTLLVTRTGTAVGGSTPNDISIGNNSLAVRNIALLACIKY